MRAVGTAREQRATPPERALVVGKTVFGTGEFMTRPHNDSRARWIDVELDSLAIKS